jgi:hypothetical protein
VVETTQPAKQNQRHLNTRLPTFTDSMNWEDVVVEESDETYPRPRAGHCAVGVSITA